MENSSMEARMWMLIEETTGTRSASNAETKIPNGSLWTTEFSSVWIALVRIEDLESRCPLSGLCKWTTFLICSGGCSDMEAIGSLENFLSCMGWRMSPWRQGTSRKRASCTETGWNKWQNLTKFLYLARISTFLFPSKKVSKAFMEFEQAICSMTIWHLEEYFKETLMVAMGNQAFGEMMEDLLSRTATNNRVTVD